MGCPSVRLGLRLIAVGLNKYLGCLRVVLRLAVFTNNARTLWPGMSLVVAKNNNQDPWALVDGNNAAVNIRKQSTGNRGGKQGFPPDP